MQLSRNPVIEARPDGKQHGALWSERLFGLVNKLERSIVSTKSESADLRALCASAVLALAAASVAFSL